MKQGNILPGVFKFFILVFALSNSGLAQTRPDVFNRLGDLYLRENGKDIRLTNYGRNGDPIVSPDGRWVAYLSSPEWKVTAPPCLEEGGGGQCFVNNVWLMNLQARKAWKLAGQTKDTWDLKKKYFPHCSGLVTRQPPGGLV